MARNAKSIGNTLLAALSADDRALLEPHIEQVKLDREQVLVIPNQPITDVYFVTRGIASITANCENGRTEVGIFGQDGVSATGMILGADRSPYETFIQVAPANALRIDADRFLAAMDRSRTLRETMLRYVQTLLIQMGQSTVANARYQIEARLARWLLMCHDRVDGDEIALTHEFMAIMIGAQRSGVTIALHILEGTGMIRSMRGRVIIWDREKLEDLAGDSYGPAEAEYRRLIGPLGKLATDQQQAINL